MINRNPSKRNLFRDLGKNKLFIGALSWVIIFLIVIILLELLI